MFAVFVFTAVNSYANTIDIKSSNSPVDVVADKLYYDKGRDLVYATGNVVITQDNQVLMADEAVYYRNTEEMYANGNLSVIREDGSVYFGDKAKLNRVKNIGIITNFKGRFGKQSLIAASYAEMVSENLMELNQMVYSPCKLCSTNFVPDTPLWQFRAASAELNREEERIYYKDATLEAFGYPVFYTPYLSTPSPGAKNKSGLLIPKARYSKIFGGRLRIPYYQTIAPNMDTTVGVEFNEKLGNVYDWEFRHKLRQGEYKFFSSLSYTDKFTKNGTFVPGKKEWKGHYDLSGRYNLKNRFFPGLFTVESMRIMDPTKTYTKKYDFSQLDVLKTDAHLRSVQRNSYRSVRSLYFQDLRPNTSTKTTAAALPQATYMYADNISSVGARGELLIDYINLNRPQGMNYNRVVSIGAIDKNYLSSFGVFWKNRASIRGDFYNVDFREVEVVSNYTPVAKKSGTETRYHPEFLSSLNMPLYRTLGRYFVTVDPIFQVVFSPKQSNLKIVDNEDSQAPEISASNLFTPNRYRGYDLLENGNRANYGIRSSIKSPYFNDLSFIAGQSFRFDKDSNFDKASGMSCHRSDYVTRINLTPDKRWQFSNAIRFDSNNFSINRNELGVNYYDIKYFLNMYYFTVNKRIIAPQKQLQYRQEAQISGGYNFYRQWWVEGFMKFKVGKRPPTPPGQTPISHMISDGLTIRNSNECLSTQIGVQRDYTRLKDLTPNTSYVLRITVPTF
jgi:LPS-assembly protein